MGLDAQLLEWLVVGALVATGLLTIVTLVLGLQLRRMRRAYASALDPDRREDLFEAVQRQARDLEGLRDDLGMVHGNTERLRELMRGAVSRVGVVRYDAFEDMGGALSFSAALLDEDSHGVVISAINGRSETRCYAKPVKAGTSEHNLSTEEQTAIEAAVSGQKGEAATVATKRRRRAS